MGFSCYPQDIPIIKTNCIVECILIHRRGLPHRLPLTSFQSFYYLRSLRMVIHVLHFHFTVIQDISIRIYDCGTDIINVPAGILRLNNCCIIIVHFLFRQKMCVGFQILHHLCLKNVVENNGH